MNDADPAQSSESVSAYAKAKEVMARHEQALLAKANVIGVGVGYLRRGGELTDTIGLVVMVRRKVPRAELAPEDFVPPEIEGVPVDVQEVGDVTPH